MSLAEVATRLLHAMAHGDVGVVRSLSRDDVIVYGTDDGERWTRMEPFLEALDGMRSLGLEASWTAPPAVGNGWVAGIARYTGRELAPTLVRVTMAFDGGLLAHAHFSVEP